MTFYIIMNFYFNIKKLISKKLQWEGVNLSYWVFLIGVSTVQ
jgi:hypothetical protein